jgi:general secretion pathway protein J
MKAHRQAAQGFTLVEVLVCLALMSLIATALVASLELGGRTWQRVTRGVETLEDTARAQDFLRQHLSALYPAGATAAGTATGFLLSNGDALEFSGFAPGAMDTGMLRYQVALSALDPDVLEVRFRPERASDDWSHERLLTGVALLSVRFFEKPPDAPGRWLDHWSDPTRPPLLIRLDVSFKPGDRRRWPPLFVAPRIDTNATCVFDTVSRSCRSGA